MVFRALALPLALALAVTAYFFATPHTLKEGLHTHGGHWGIFDSEFNWCESDYQHHSMIAETWNTLTSLLYFVAPAAAYSKYGHLLNLNLWVVVLSGAAVGVGSTLFHATLRYHNQLADEIPMFVLVTAAARFLHSRHNKNDHVGARVMFALQLASAGVLWFSPRHTTLHEVVRGTMSVSFGISFAYIYFAGTRATEECAQLLSKATRSSEAVAVRSAFSRAQTCMLIGIVCWLTDIFFCGWLRKLPFNPQLHALGWHVFTALGVWFTFVFMVTHHALHALDYKPEDVVCDPAKSKMLVVAFKDSAKKRN